MISTEQHHQPEQPVEKITQIRAPESIINH